MSTFQPGRWCDGVFVAGETPQAGDHPVWVRTAARSRPASSFRPAAHVRKHHILVRCPTSSRSPSPTAARSALMTAAPATRRRTCWCGTTARPSPGACCSPCSTPRCPVASAWSQSPGPATVDPPGGPGGTSPRSPPRSRPWWMRSGSSGSQRPGPLEAVPTPLRAAPSCRAASRRSPASPASPRTRTPSTGGGDARAGRPAGGPRGYDCA